MAVPKFVSPGFIELLEQFIDSADRPGEVDVPEHGICEFIPFDDPVPDPIGR